MAIELIAKITPKNDGFTGMVDGDQILWAGNDVDIYTSGDIGVGTESPDGPIHIKGAGNVGPLVETTGSSSKAQFGFQTPVKLWTCGVNGDDDFHITNNVTVSFKIDGSTNDVSILAGDLTITDMSSAGFVKNSAAGLLSGGNSVDISSDTNLVAGTNITLSGDTLNVDDAFLKNDAVDVGVGLSLTGDNSSADTAYVPNVLYNTDATPPTASTVPIGTIYVQYTA